MACSAGVRQLSTAETKTAFLISHGVLTSGSLEHAADSQVQTYKHMYLAVCSVFQTTTRQYSMADEKCCLGISCAWLLTLRTPAEQAMHA